MRPCQAAPAFDTTMSTPPKLSTTRANASRTEVALGHVARERERSWADGLGFVLGGAPVDVE